MDELPVIPFPVVTMGSFDGVHVGHRVIISRLKHLAEQVAGSSVLITFDPHPRQVLYPETEGKELRLINSQSEKIRLLEETGLDHLVILPFTLGFSRTSSEDFVKEYLVRRLSAHTIVVGFNHYFGHKREGSYDSLYRLRESHGFKVEEIPGQEIQHETVSSTRIRKALAEGNIQRANAYLEHHYFLQASMMLHTGYTRRFNHACYQVGSNDPLKLIPPLGTYAVSLKYESDQAKGLIWIWEEDMLYLPLDPGDVACSTEAGIRFHKRLAGVVDMNLLQVLDDVRELIY